MHYAHQKFPDVAAATEKARRGTAGEEDEDSPTFRRKTLYRIQEGYRGATDEWAAQTGPGAERLGYAGRE